LGYACGGPLAQAEERVGAVYYYDANTFLARPTIDVRPSGSMLNDAGLQGVSARAEEKDKVMRMVSSNPLPTA